ncbi:hypothetical protein ACJ41O_007536 [Fusarium nematophilum]
MTKVSKPSVRDRLSGCLNKSGEALVRQICADSGTPGLALGVFDPHGIALEKYIGYRDTSRELAPDGDTVFNLGSMGKGFTALAAACLVSDGRLRWDEPIDTYLDDLRGTETGKFTTRDLLSHRTGLCRSDALFVGSDNRLLLTQAQGTNVFASLDASRPPRQDFVYNNFGYHAVGCVIEKASLMSYSEFLQQRIFDPLKMNHTFTTLPPESNDNVAQAYVPYNDMRLRQVPAPRISGDTVAFGAGCIRSCMRDLLIFYRALLHRFTGSATESLSEKLNVAPDAIQTIFEATMPLHAPPRSLREQSYGMGWARTQLPNQMSEISGNSGLLDSYPVIGDVANGPLVFHHGGNNLGCSSAVYLIPELETGFVVLGNALGHCDATDWIAQVLTEVCLYGIVHTPFLDYVAAAALKGRSAMERVQAVLDREKEPGDPPSYLQRYTGCFWHKTHQFRIVVALVTDSGRSELRMSLQGRDDETYTLRHYHKDTFVFNETFDQVVDRGQWCRPYWFYKIEFLLGKGGVEALRWRIDDTEEQGQIFKRDQ